jgi:hypothetical protein
VAVLKTYCGAQFSGLIGVVTVICRSCRHEEEMNEPRPVRFPSFLRIRIPEQLPAVIAAAADKRMTTSSEYVRQAVIERLKADGIEELSAA